MNKLRWAMDGGVWDVDVSTPATVDGVARPVSGVTLPLGLSRGARLSRPKQADFFQRFMAMPFIPSLSGAGLSFQRALSLPLPDNWFSAFLGQFNVHKFVTSLKRNEVRQETLGSSLKSIWGHLSDPNLYAVNFLLEWLLTPEDRVQLGFETQGYGKNPRRKAVFHHKARVILFSQIYINVTFFQFPNHDLVVEASSPALFVDRFGKYWDVPFTLSVDVSSLASDSSTSCHFCINHTMGSPKQCEGEPVNTPVPRGLFPGLCGKCAYSYKKDFDLWRSEAPKTKMVLPYDIFLSTPHISASALLGTVITASLGDNSTRAHEEDESFGLQARGAYSALSADLFASASLSAQHGNFQKPFLDLTRFYARLDIPSGSKFLAGASQVASDLCSSRVPSLEAFQAVCPSASLSFQQQIAGPFSFRMDAGVTVDLKKECYVNVNDPVFAVEYALQVLASAKAIAWYSPRHREFMLELRFFET
ncbi:pigment defective 320 [Striga asiatica]|uniref:Pigment defective 320 n=1 Tax=Striga asiatica TaxID=4170 RepID=A0A5A7PFF5_STRAF|nr:pigment defective 320 [Striga asiatica]